MIGKCSSATGRAQDLVGDADGQGLTAVVYMPEMADPLNVDVETLHVYVRQIRDCAVPNASYVPTGGTSEITNGARRKSRFIIDHYPVANEMGGAS